MSFGAQQLLQPRKRGIDVGALGCVRNGGPRDHHHRNTELTRGLDLGVCRRPASVLADHDIDAVMLQQRQFIRERKWPALENNLRLRRQTFSIRRIDSAHQIAVLRRGRERRHLLAADGKKGALRLLAQRCSRRSHIRNDAPIVARLQLPFSPLQSQQRNVSDRGSFNGVARHLRRERMGCINHRTDALIHQPARQTIHTAEAADAAGCGGQQRLLRAARERIKGVETGIARKTLGQLKSFRRAAENENAHDTP